MNLIARHFIFKSINSEEYSYDVEDNDLQAALDKQINSVLSVIDMEQNIYLLPQGA